MSKLVVASILVLSTAAAFGQSFYGGAHLYNQFRTWSALPGSGYGLMPDGDIDPNGAIAYSTPIAYSLGQWRAVVGLGNLSSNFTPAMFNFPGESTVQSSSNGTSALEIGYDFGNFGLVSQSYMILSSIGDHVNNFHWLPFRQKGRLLFGLGVQDTNGHGGAGEIPPALWVHGHNPDTDSSTSGYGVATYDTGWNGTYVSVGAGTHRFEHGFANASTNLFPSAKFFVEYEGWYINTGITYSIPVGRVMIQRGKYRKLALNLSIGEAADQFVYYGIFLTL